MRARLGFAAAVWAFVALAGCARRDSPAAPPHEDLPPHGGTVVALGGGIYNLELVLDASDGRMDAYLLDGEMENFIRTAAPSFEMTASSDGDNRRLVFRAAANPATGETVGDTSQFEARADWLRTARNFKAVLDELNVRGTAFSHVAFKFPNGNDSMPPPLRVVALSPVLTEIATEIGGSETAVTGLLPLGVDPHTFEPAPADMRSLADADLILASGLGLENYLGKLAANSGTRAKIAAVGDVLRDRLVTIKAPGGREPDPHWWNSITATEEVTRAAAGQLAILRPEAAADFSRRAAARVARLAALDAWTRSQFAALPPARRQLVTSHDAFGWFARDYGFTVHPIAGLSPGAEPDAHDLARLVDLLRKERIPAVFIENSESSRLAEALAREAGVRLGGTLYADGLVPGPDGSTYEAMFRHNVLTIVNALQ